MDKITVTIALDKIQEDRSWEYNGTRYISMTLIPTPENQYGKDYMCKQYWKEEGLPAGKYPDHPILGNGKTMKQSSEGPAVKTESASPF